MQQNGSKYFAPDIGGHKSNFSDLGPVVYQIKGNGNCSNTKAHIPSLHTSSESSHVAYQIKRQGA